MEKGIEFEPTALARVVRAASPTKGTYADSLAKKAEASISTVYRARDLGLLGRPYFRTQSGQVYLDFNFPKRVELYRLLKREQSKHPSERGFVGNEPFTPSFAKEYWVKYHESIGRIVDIDSFLYWLYVEKGIASNPDLFLKILRPEKGPYLVRLHVNGKGRIAYFIWQ